MLTELQNLEIYGFVDPAGGKSRLSKVRSRQAIVLIGVDHLVRIFALYAWAGRLSTSKFRDKIIKEYEQWKPRRMGIESNGTQVLFGDLVVEKARETHEKIKLMPIPAPQSVDKIFKIRTTLEPIINDGRLFIPEEMIELRSEIQSFPTGRFKDLVDTLASAIMLIPRRAPVEVHNAEIDAYADYLRRTGAPAEYIIQEIGKMRREVEMTHFAAPPASTDNLLTTLQGG